MPSSFVGRFDVVVLTTLIWNPNESEPLTLIRFAHAIPGLSQNPWLVYMKQKTLHKETLICVSSYNTYDILSNNEWKKLC